MTSWRDTWFDPYTTHEPARTIDVAYTSSWMYLDYSFWWGNLSYPCHASLHSSNFITLTSFHFCQKPLRGRVAYDGSTTSIRNGWPFDQQPRLILGVLSSESNLSQCLQPLLIASSEGKLRLLSHGSNGLGSMTPIPRYDPTWSPLGSFLQSQADVCSFWTHW
jgi:hypothetical protein